MYLNLFFLALGLAMLVRGDAFAVWAVRRHEQRSDELKSGGAEAYFEERRSLSTYPPFAKAGLWRLLGGLLVASIIGRLLTH
jgi:hypothetical protein